MTTLGAKLPGSCDYCNHIHQGVCPMVKAIEYFPDGSIKRVEFKTATDYPQQAIVAPAVFGSAPAHNAGEEA